MKRKLFFVCLVLVITMFLVGCGGSGIPTTPPVTSNQSPIASFTATPTSGVAPLEVSFNASNSSDSDGTIISYAWDFKDGNTGNGETISHTFSFIGNYNVKLTITDNEGATDSTTKIITVTETPNQSPIASFTANPTSGVAPLEVSFNASSSSDSDGSITSYAWDFKDGDTGNGETISHTFSSTGSYNVELTVTDNEGATDSITKTITVTYEYKVEYKIWGSATSVFITLSNSTGGTEQYSDVILPKVYSYSYFSDNFLYISAQNNGSSGTVNVECYYEGILKDSAHSEGAYVIATASYFISDY